MEENTNQQPQDLREQLRQALYGEEGTPAEPVETAEGAQPAAETPADAPAEGAADAGAQAESPVPPAESTVPPAEGAVPQNPANAGNANQPGLPSMDALTQVMSRTNAVLQQLQQENAQLRAQIQQQSQVAEQKMEEVAAQPVMPVLDTSRWGYLTDEQRAEESTKYTQALTDYIRAQMDGEIAPIKKMYEQQARESERSNAISRLSEDARLPGFKDALPQIQNIIDKTPSLANESPINQLQIAYLINRGLNQGQEKSASQLAQEAMDNPEVMRIIESKRAQDVKAKNAEVPVASASTGMSQAAAIPDNRPKTMEEANRMLESLRFN